jgi:hypothetical protein
VRRYYCRDCDSTSTEEEIGEAACCPLCDSVNIKLIVPLLARDVLQKTGCLPVTAYGDLDAVVGWQIEE